MARMSNNQAQNLLTGVR